MCVLKGGASFFQDLVQALRMFHDWNDQNYVSVQSILHTIHVFVTVHVSATRSIECQNIPEDRIRMDVAKS